MQLRSARALKPGCPAYVCMEIKCGCKVLSLRWLDIQHHCGSSWPPTSEALWGISIKAVETMQFQTTYWENTECIYFFMLSSKSHWESLSQNCCSTHTHCCVSQVLRAQSAKASFSPSCPAWAGAGITNHENSVSPHSSPSAWMHGNWPRSKEGKLLRCNLR